MVVAGEPMSTPYCSNRWFQLLRTLVVLPIANRPVAHEYGAWCRKTNFHLRVVVARSFCSHASCVPSQQLSESVTVKCASPESNE